MFCCASLNRMSLTTTITLLQAMLGPEPAAMEPALAQEGGDLLNDAVGVDVVDEVEDPPMDDRNESLMVAEDIVETNNPSSEPSLLSKTVRMRTYFCQRNL